MSWLFSRPKKNDLFAIFDIGTGSVAASLVSVPAETASCPTIVWHQEIKIDFSQKPDKKRLLHNVLTATKEVAESLHRAWPDLKVPAHCLLSSPFYRGQTKTVIFEEDEPFTVSAALLAKIREAEAQEFLALTNKPYDDIPGDKKILLEQKLLQFTADGHKLLGMPGRPIKELEVTQYLSISSEAIIKRLKDIIAGPGHFKKIYFHSYLLALSTAIAFIKRETPEFIVLDAGGERLDFGLVRQGLLVNERSFSWSGRQVVRTVAEHLGMTPGVLTTYTKMKPVKTDDKFKEQWLAETAKNLRLLAAGTILPRPLYLLVEEPVHANILTDWLKELDYEINVVLPTIFDGFCDLAPGVSRTKPIVALAEALYLSRVAENEEELL